MTNFKNVSEKYRLVFKDFYVKYDSGFSFIKTSFGEENKNSDTLLSEKTNTTTVPFLKC